LPGAGDGHHVGGSVWRGERVERAGGDRRRAPAMLTCDVRS